MISALDDGVVVGAVKNLEFCMKVPVGVALQDCLGESGVRDLHDYMEEHRHAWRIEMVNAIADRLDHRINACATREDMTIAFARVEKQMSEMKVEILRWSFLFWIGQVATIAALLSYMLK